MRRAFGIALIALGMFAVAFGLMLGPVVHDRLAKAPLDPDSVTESEGTGMTLFYARSVVDKTVQAQRTDATVTARVVVRGKLDAPEVKVDGDVAMWRVGIVIQDDRRELISAVEHGVCLDRKTNHGVKPCAQQKIDDGRTPSTDFDPSGINYKFPFDTQRRDYQWFDTTLRRALPITFDGEDTVNGLRVYRFVQRIEETKVDDRPVPASLVGGPEGTMVTAGRYYQNTRRLWVEPYTGGVVNSEENVRQVLRGPDGRGGPVIIAGKLSFTPQTVQRQVDRATEGRDQLRLLKDTGPVAAYLSGGLVLAAGVVLVLLATPKGTAHRRGDRRTPGQPVPLVRSGSG